MVSPSSYVSVVATAFVTIFPFYGLVAKLTNLNHRSLELCTDSSPCQWTQLFDTRTKPRIYPLTVQVRSNVTRPTMIAKDWSAGTVAIYKKPAPSVQMVFLGIFCGGFKFEVPSASNSSQWTNQWAICLCGLCVDDEFHFSAPAVTWPLKKVASLFGVNLTLESALDRSYERVQNASDVLSSDVAAYFQQHDETRQAVDEITSALTTCRLNVVGDVAWFVWARIEAFYVTAYTFWTRNPRPDLLPSPRCDELNPEAMAEICRTDEQHGKVENTLADQASTKVYLASVVGWAATSAAHDIFLLRGWSEAVTLVVGAASVACQGIAVGAGFLAAMGATEVFIAPVTQVKGEPCGCYYKMDYTVAMLLLSTPAVLLYKYIGKKKILLQTVVNGDCLYNVRFNVPYYIVSQNKGWPTHSLLLPTLTAPQGNNPQLLKAPAYGIEYRVLKAPEPRTRFSNVGLRVVYRAVKLVIGTLDLFCCRLAVFLAGSSMFATSMSILLEQAWLEHGVLSRVSAFLATCPCLIVVASLVLHVSNNRHRILAGELRTMFQCAIWGCIVQLIYPRFVFTNEGPSPSEKLVIYNYWEVGGFTFVIVSMVMLERVSGVHWAQSAFEACVDPPEKMWDAWQADYQEMVGSLEITTPRALRKRLLEA